MSVPTLIAVTILLSIVADAMARTMARPRLQTSASAGRVLGPSPRQSLRGGSARQQPASRGRTGARVATIVTVSLLMLLAPAQAAAPIRAAPQLSVSPSSAAPGESIEVSAVGFDPHDQGSLLFDGEAAGMPAYRVRGNGTLSESMTVPADAAAGDHTIGTTTESATAALQVVVPAAPTPTPTVAPTPTPTSSPTTSPSPTPTVRPTPTPPPAASIEHVIVVWMENEESTGITASTMPYLYGLSETYGRAEQFYGVAHPSLPNYLAFWSGSTQGVTDDGTYNFTSGETLATQFDDAGLSWRAYMQDYPTSGCFTGSSYSDGTRDGWGVNGTYVRRHNPPMSWTAVSGDPQECSKVQPLANFNPSVNFAFISPNLCNDMHDCSLATGDAFLEAFLPQVLESPEWPHTLLIVSFDEGSSGTNGGGHIFTMIARQDLSGVASSTFHDHYGAMRTVEDIFGLPCLKASCNASPLNEFLP